MVSITLYLYIVTKDLATSFMIIFYFLALLLCCGFYRPQQIKETKYEGDSVLIYSSLKTERELDAKIEEFEEEQERVASFEPLAQLYLQKGIQNNRLEDLIKARSFALACLSTEEVFQVEFLNQSRMYPGRIDIQTLWTEASNCTDGHRSEVLSLPAQPLLVACATWAVISWAKLTKMYQMERISIDSDRILYLALWLGEHRNCFSWPWIPYALSLSLAQARQELVERKNLMVWMDDFFEEAMKSEHLHVEVSLDRIATSVESSTLSAEDREKMIQKLNELLGEELNEIQKSKIQTLRKQLRD